MRGSRNEKHFGEQERLRRGEKCNVMTDVLRTSVPRVAGWEEWQKSCVSSSHTPGPIVRKFAILRSLLPSKSLLRSTIHVVNVSPRVHSPGASRSPRCLPTKFVDGRCSGWSTHKIQTDARTQGQTDLELDICRCMGRKRVKDMSLLFFARISI